uniref:Uncharacterized protein n=1 Tax=Amphimedon queenslandica TaxID=400682 RepID=A0A1X7UQ22_AMPQE
TATFRLQYIEYKEIVKLFIRAERVGDWNMHYVSVEKMLNLFAVTGHINCAKSSQLYLQQMLELPVLHNDIGLFIEIVDIGLVNGLI